MHSMSNLQLAGDFWCMLFMHTCHSSCSAHTTSVSCNCEHVQVQLQRGLALHMSGNTCSLNLCDMICMQEQLQGLEGQVAERDAELEKLQEQLVQLTEDFRYNLKVAWHCMFRGFLLAVLPEKMNKPLTWLPDLL